MHYLSPKRSDFLMATVITEFKILWQGFTLRNLQLISIHIYGLSGMSFEEEMKEAGTSRDTVWINLLILLHKIWVMLALRETG